MKVGLWLSVVLLLVCGSVYAAKGDCRGNRVFACSSLPSLVSLRNNCHLYYECRESPSGDSCYPCRSSKNQFDRGLCAPDYKKRCLKKDV